MTATAADPPQAGPLPLRTLAKGGFSGIQEPLQQLIKDPAHWEKVWSAHNAGRKSEQNRPEIDFTKEMVILATMGRKNTGGYSIEITKAEVSGDQLKVYVTRKTPRPGGMSLQALTAPFHMAAVPKTELKPEFVENPASPAHPAP
jgi:hypothetical protein